MISPTAIREFLNRKLDDHSWMKNLSEQRVDEAINSLRPKPHLGEFGVHQKVGFLLGVSYTNFYFIYEMGLGKSRLSARLLEYHYATGLLNKWSLILVPMDEVVLGWGDEFEKIGFSLPYLLLSGPTEKKWRDIDGFKKGVIVATYMGFSAMVSELQPVKGKNGKAKSERVPNPAWVGYIANQTEALVMDQATAVGNPQSLSYAVTNAISKRAKVRYALAGVPFGRNPEIAWPQFNLVDHGASLGNTLGMFREAFFIKKKKYWGGPYSYEYKPNKQRAADFARALGHRSLQYEVKEGDLPDLVQTKIRVELSEEQRSYYERVTEALMASKGNYHAIENSFIRMRQICSGFLGFIDDDTEDRVQIEFKSNPKLAALIVKLQEMPEGRKCLIWHEYSWTGSRVCRELAKLKMPHGWLWGGTKDWEQTKERFENDPNFKALVISHKKGSMGLNLQAANFDFIVESPVSPISRREMERRTWRQGQKNTVFRYDIVIRDSVEEKILGFHKTGRDLMRELVTNPQKTLGY